MEELQDQLADLKRRLAREKEEKDRLAIENEKLLRGAVMDSGTVRQGGSTTKVEVVYVPREKRCKVYTGKASSVPLSDWIEDLKSVFKARNFTPDQAVDYIWEHLEGEAKQEIKYRSKETRSRPEGIFEALLEVFGSAQSFTALQRQFFERQQGKTETLIEFSHALMALLKELKSCNPKGVSAEDVMLRDQFAENVRSKELCRELKRMIRQKPSLTFLDVRKEAVEWATDGVRVSETSFGSENFSTIDSEAVIAKQSTDPMLVELFGMVKSQQKQLSDLTEKMSKLQVFNRQQQGVPRRLYSFDPSGQPICFKCQKVGHIGRYCSEIVNPSQVWGQQRHLVDDVSNPQAQKSGPLN